MADKLALKSLWDPCPPGYPGAKSYATLLHEERRVSGLAVATTGSRWEATLSQQLWGMVRAAQTPPLVEQLRICYGLLSLC